MNTTTTTKENIMGLDQYLYAKQYTSESSFANPDTFSVLKEAIGTDIKFLVKESPSISVEMKVGQWRKSNQIHQYFVDNCQGGEDDCRESYVDRSKIEELLDLCKQVLADHSKAEDLLPAQSGFFFGSTDYNEWYFSDLEDTVSILENCLTMDEGWSFYYQSSW
jgi:hypothetical protein